MISHLPARTLRLLRGDRLSFATLQHLLVRWGVYIPKDGHCNCRKCKQQIKKNNCYFDLYFEARDVWRKEMAKHHPDRGGNARRAAKVNAMWDRTEELFRRRGIP